MLSPHPLKAYDASFLILLFRAPSNLPRSATCAPVPGLWPWDTWTAPHAGELVELHAAHFLRRSDHPGTPGEYKKGPSAIPQLTVAPKASPQRQLTR